ncbi:hypothetical protein NQ314_011627 [Rhamnusium bicolor]|uniref:MADF domain-containing protein n=1 Tax=Rhamnusium bicolor TaxID=1586634 RepID=A0AAV8XGS8_9CUCU|nr:hypothetical protein NQ314_011627 [Rhamnusium bicolor]
MSFKTLRLFAALSVPKGYPQEVPNLEEPKLGRTRDVLLILLVRPVVILWQSGAVWVYTHGYIRAVVPEQDESYDSDESQAQATLAQTLLGQTEIKPEDEQYLIPLIEARPLLWDFRIPLKNRGKEIIRSLWEEIIMELGVNMSVEEVRGKWKSIRDSFIRARNNYKKRIPSGTSAEQKLEAEKNKK